MARVLVTRSEPGASETAERLIARGHAPIVEPVFAVEPIAVDLPPCDALAFTSANAARVFARLDPRRDLPVFAVGARTAEAAREMGFAQVRSADSDVDGLYMLILAAAPPDARLLHAGNEDTRGDLVGRLVAAGRAANFRAIYRAAPVPAPGPVLGRWLSGEAAFDAILIHSPRGGAILAGLLQSAPSRKPFLAAISRAAAQPLAARAQRIEIAAAPNESALLDALDILLAAS